MKGTFSLLGLGIMLAGSAVKNNSQTSSSKRSSENDGEGIGCTIIFCILCFLLGVWLVSSELGSLMCDIGALFIIASILIIIALIITYTYSKGSKKDVKKSDVLTFEELKPSPPIIKPKQSKPKNTTKEKLPLQTTLDFKPDTTIISDSNITITQISKPMNKEIKKYVYKCISKDSNNSVKTQSNAIAQWLKDNNIKDSLTIGISFLDTKSVKQKIDTYMECGDLLVIADYTDISQDVNVVLEIFKTIFEPRKIKLSICIFGSEKYDFSQIMCRVALITKIQAVAQDRVYRAKSEESIEVIGVSTQIQSIPKNISDRNVDKLELSSYTNIKTEDIKNLLDRWYDDGLINISKNWRHTVVGDKITLEKQERNGLLRRTSISKIYVRPEIFDQIQSLINDDRILDKNGAFAKYGFSTDYALLKYCASGAVIQYRRFGGGCLLYIR